MKRIVIALLLTTTLINVVKSQKDMEFWFVAPPITKDHSAAVNICNCDGGTRCGAAPVSLYITNSDLDTLSSTTVMIEMPANKYDAITNPTGFKDTIIYIPPNTTERVELWGNDLCEAPNYSMRKLIENRLDLTNPKTILKKGLHITATNLVTIYYEVEEQNNSDIFVLKGANALGDEFYTPFQTNKENGNRTPQQAFSSINIVATDPGTTNVWVYPTDSVIGWGKPDSFMISLKQGETYCIVPGVDNGGGNYTYNRAPGNRLKGTYIRTENGKRIAVTLSDDSVKGDTGCMDLLGDQLIPLEAIRNDGTRKQLIGTEYIVMKGDLGNSNNDRIYIVSTQVNTTVTVSDITNATSTNYNLATPGTQQTHTIPATGNITYVNADKPVYVLHVTGAGGGCELGQAILPTISKCRGSFDVGFSRGSSINKDFSLNIMVREINPGDPDSVRYAFTLNNNPNTIDGDDFINIPGTPWWAAQFHADTIPTGSSNILSNSKNIFHLGTFNGGASNGGNYGYFSDYCDVEARAYVSGTGQEGIKLCYGETVQLKAMGGRHYEWIPGTYLSDSTIANPYVTPLTNIKYNVVVKGANCISTDTAEITILVGDSLRANFITDVDSGCAPLTLDITNNSYGNLKNYWYLNNILESSVRNPDTFILQNSTSTVIDYKLKLIATQNILCSDSLEKTIHVFPQIAAAFSANDTVGCSPLMVNFTNQSVDSIFFTYQWDFNDSDTSTEQNPTHIFENISNNIDTLLVKQIITSPSFCSDTTTGNIIVYPSTQADFTLSDTIVCDLMLVTFTNNSAGNSLTYMWDFGDSDTSLQQTPSHIFTNNTNTLDTFNVKQIVTSLLCSDSDTAEAMVVVNPIPVVGFLPDNDTLACNASPVDFINYSTGYNLTYHWDFDDSNSSSEQNPSHSFENISNGIDTFSVKQVVTSNSLCKDSSTTKIIVYPDVNANFTASDTIICDSSLVSFTNNSAGIDLVYNWDFGDAITSTQETPSHIFTNNSGTDTTYLVKQIATSLPICSDTATTVILVRPLPNSNFVVSDSIICNSAQIDFTDYSTGSNLNYHWDFDNSNISSEQNPSHNFENISNDIDTFLIKQIVTSNSLCKDSSTTKVVVYPSVIANFTASETTACDSVLVFFTNNSTGVNLSYVWNFDNNEMSSQKHPSEVFYSNDNDSIIYNISLIANSANLCIDTFTTPIIIYSPIQAGFEIEHQGNCSPLNISLNNTSTAPSNAKYIWNMGDGTKYSVINENIIEHVLLNNSKEDKEFTISLKASKANCSSEAVRNVVVYKSPKSIMQLNDTVVCSPFIETLINKSKNATEPEWYINGRFYSSLDTASIMLENNSSEKDSIVSIKLLVSSDNGCTDTSNNTIRIFPKVSASFTTQALSDTTPYTIVFNNTSSGASNYFWEFGDGSTSNAQNPEHEYVSGNNKDSLSFLTKLFVTSENGCENMSVRIVHINPSIPSAIINYTHNGNVKAYPNPFTNNIWLTIESLRNTSANIAMYDMQGKLILQTLKINIHSGSNNIKLPLNTNYKGLVLMHVIIEDKSFTLKLNKQ